LRVARSYGAEPLVKSGAAIAFDNISFNIPAVEGVRQSSHCAAAAGPAIGWWPVRRRKSSLSRCVQRFYDVQQATSKTTSHGQDICEVYGSKPASGRSRSVPQNISLFQPLDPGKTSVTAAERV